jgi:predicted dehydrogenase
MATSRPRVGFLGVGWIGRNRMEAMLAAGAVEAVAIADHLRVPGRRR